MSQFRFLHHDWPPVFEAAAKAETAVHADPRIACFYARRALELAVGWAYQHDLALQRPYQDNLSALVHEPTFKRAAGEAVFNKARLIIRLGNQAVHSDRPVAATDALVAVRELFHVGYWFARTYARGGRPVAGLTFDVAALPNVAPVPGKGLDPGLRRGDGMGEPVTGGDSALRHSGERRNPVSATPNAPMPSASQRRADIEQLQQLEASLRQRDEQLAALAAASATRDEELARLRAEVAEAKRAAAAQPDTHDYAEAETRDYLIDVLLKEAGWPLDQPHDREVEVAGMPNAQGKGFVDYVLWGEDGKPLALVEAKRTRRDPRVGQQQAKLYADCLEQQFGQRPVIFYSNGYDHWLWDDAAYPPRPVQGFYRRDELELVIQRRASRQPLGAASIDSAIVERYYQTRAIRRIGEAFERDRERKALVVMATGAGKTRTVIALCDLLMRCNWVKRVLFLADRVALVKQAVNAFKVHLPDAAPVNLVTERAGDGRVFVATYPTMMGLIDETRDGQRRFGVGYFDLVIIDEAHRSVFQKYRAIFDYFDALLVGLTATPKDEVDRNTYSLFDLENGVPTDAYTLEEAVREGYLVPPEAVSVPLKFQREGIRYADLAEDDKDQWDALEWDEDGGVPDKVEAAAVNKWLFNLDTVDKVLAHLMTRGLRVAGGDRLGKTIVFAKNQEHAEFIAERFNANYPHFKGQFARVITFKTEYAQSLIDAFTNQETAPHIAISVDMLDTGIDVPEVVNLVFFKLVRSKTKFWQMVGRGTRLCPDLFGPGQPKQSFFVFDYCQNLEFFSQDFKPTEGALGESLGARLFKARLEMLGELDRHLAAEAVHHQLKNQLKEGQAAYDGPTTTADVRQAIAALLRGEVAAMNLDNFVVRAKRRHVEPYAQADAWTALSAETLTDLATNVAGLPSELAVEPEEAKRFDLLVLHLQLALLRHEPGFERLRKQVITIAGLLEELSAIPLVAQHLTLIQDVQTDEWWQDVTTPMLEGMRRRLRQLVPLIEKHKRKPVYTNFEDLMGPETSIALAGFATSTDFEKFRAKAQAFLRAHQDHVAIHKLRMNRPLSATDLADLERILVESGVGTTGDLDRARQEAQGLGLFVRSLVGLDREAAKGALSSFLTNTTLRADQIEFVNLVVNHLTEHGVMDAARLYESPFTDVTPHGPDALFTPAQVDELVAVLDQVRATAVAA